MQKNYLNLPIGFTRNQYIEWIITQGFPPLDGDLFEIWSKGAKDIAYEDLIDKEIDYPTNKIIYKGRFSNKRCAVDMYEKNLEEHIFNKILLENINLKIIHQDKDGCLFFTDRKNQAVYKSSEPSLYSVYNMLPWFSCFKVKIIRGPQSIYRSEIHPFTDQTQSCTAYPLYNVVFVDFLGIGSKIEISQIGA